MNPTEAQIRADRRRLENPYAHVDYLHPTGSGRRLIDRSALVRLVGGRRVLSKFEIERVAHSLLSEMWQQRAHILVGMQDSEPRDILVPELALKALGYSIDEHASLGQFGVGRELIEVAGQISPIEESVDVSLQSSPDVRRFTLAHELGHAMLHPGMRLHRDGPLDGSVPGGAQRLEREANAFAAAFLMPQKLVRKEFEWRFFRAPFLLTEASAFALASASAAAVNATCGSARGLARKLSEAIAFNGVMFSSLSECFDVSVGAMAIRLEELGLVTNESVSG
jgi:Zn-dependent peptidase ImmA (M78 family)